VAQTRPPGLPSSLAPCCCLARVSVGAFEEPLAGMGPWKSAEVKDMKLLRYEVIQIHHQRRHRQLGNIMQYPVFLSLPCLCCSEHALTNGLSYFQIYTNRDSHHTSRPILLSSTPKQQTIQRRPSILGVPPHPRYKFTRWLGGEIRKTDRAPQ